MTKKMVEQNILAKGEHTGHFHQAQGPDVAVYEEDGRVLLEAPNGASVTHQEHHKLELPPGLYVRKLVQERDHFLEESRTVKD